MAVAGVALMLIGMLLLALSSLPLRGGEVSGAIVVIPFVPIPIGVGFGEHGYVLGLIAAAIALAIFLAMLILAVAMARKARGG
ncbi:hypothetical protein B6U99_01505 [Candidatus Geothermarchaeota archaeon ex4572_27]|nr:MAG: hypothetical protein B6U99_01505 [Candidatus Geothermarchaeota archaeon ex4572_27]